MKIKSTFFIFFVCILMRTSIAFASGTCSEVTGAVSARYEEQNRKATEIYDGMIKVPDKDALERCLDGINGADTFSIGIPSIGDWFNELCDFANDTIAEQTADFQQRFKYEPLPGFTVESSGGVRQTGNGGSYSGDVRVKTNSAPKARDILDKIRE